MHNVKLVFKPMGGSAANRNHLTQVRHPLREANHRAVGSTQCSHKKGELQKTNSCLLLGADYPRTAIPKPHPTPVQQPTVALSPSHTSQIKPVALKRAPGHITVTPSMCSRTYLNVGYPPSLLTAALVYFLFRRQQIVTSGL